MRNLELRTGALAPKLAEQLSRQKVYAETVRVRLWQKSLNAVNLLRIMGFLSGAEAGRANARILRQIARQVSRL